MKFLFKKITIKKMGTSLAAGFTLVETLVAITILMISIVGPLTIASKGLIAAVGSRDQVIASYLAQDEMEYLENTRDDYLLNPDTKFGWNGFIGLLDGFNCASGSTGVCGIESAPSVSQGTLLGCNGANASKCYLYTDPNFNYYTYYSSGSSVQTQFNRTFTVTKEDVNGTNPPDAALVTVTVSWKNGTIQNQVVLNNMFFNSLR